MLGEKDSSLITNYVEQACLKTQEEVPKSSELSTVTNTQNNQTTEDCLSLSLNAENSKESNLSKNFNVIRMNKEWKSYNLDLPKQTIRMKPKNNISFVEHTIKKGQTRIKVKPIVKNTYLLCKKRPIASYIIRNNLDIAKKNKEFYVEESQSKRNAHNYTNLELIETEVTREITKEMFLKMEILGQFNLGFILVILDDDLFVIDQHASDEKFNFEHLHQNVIIQSQPLVCPQLLSFTLADEITVIDNLEVFKKNGFYFKIDYDAPITQRIHLISKPISKNFNFGKNDIQEMIYLLNRSMNNNQVKPTRFREMIASRACRKSIMIGDALKKSDMRRIVDNLSKLQSPWNCPHGRPTLRHLVNIHKLFTDARIDI